MLLSGIFFVSLHHQSNRKIMFRKTDPNPQLDIFTAPSMQLGSRASKKYSDPNSWHNQFYSLVTTKIDEEFTCEADCYVSLRMTTLVMLDSKYAPF